MTIDEILAAAKMATPGPWEAGAGKLWGHNVLGVFVQPNKMIAACGEQRASDEAETIANALLIAGAPQLAAEVVRLRSVLRKLEPEGMC